MKQTAAYYRSSTDLQEDSVPVQQYNINKYALQRGILIDVEYMEPAVSARKNKLNDRPQMRLLMKNIREGKVNQLIVYKRDRLARKVEEHLELYKLFKNHRIDVHFIAENEPPMRFDIFGELMELFIAVMNQREGEEINRRIIDTKIGNFLRGETVGNLPYGYSTNKEKTKIIREENELKIVKRIFEEWNSDSYENTGKLAERLEKDEVGRREEKWTSGNVKSVLLNPIYMGIRVANYGGKQYEKSIEDLKIIEVEDFNLAQDLIDKRKKPREEQEKFDYLLSELCFCELCEEERLITQKATGERTAQIPMINHQRMQNGEIYATYECKDHGIKLPQEQIENEVYLKTKKFFTDLLDNHFELLYSAQSKKNLSQLAKLKDDLNNELVLAEEKLLKATDKWIKNDNELNKDKVTEYSSDVKKKKESIYKIIEKMNEFKMVPLLNEEIKKEITKKETWGALPFKRKQLLIRDLIHCIYVGEYTIRIVFKHPYLEDNEVNRNNSI